MKNWKVPIIEIGRPRPFPTIIEYVPEYCFIPLASVEVGVSFWFAPVFGYQTSSEMSLVWAARKAW
jgi:hypothetical protein